MWGRLLSGGSSPPPAPPRTLARELGEQGLSLDTWQPSPANGSALYVDVPGRSVRDLGARYPTLAEATVSAAERILRHEFDLLGSGPFVPTDPDRQAGADGYQTIDWYWDPVSRLRFPRGVRVEDWDLFKMRPGLADIKLPWELGRCQHWVTLGQAYRLTGDARYAREIERQLGDFLEANPVGIGVQWTCTMDVALRAASWAMGLSLVRGCRELGADFWPVAWSSLFDHGTFIESHLENGFEVTSNHYLSDLVGLFFTARVFRGLPQGRRWDALCRASIEEEMARQVLDDGADFESSIPYHRLVAELFLGAARLAEVAEEPLSDAFTQRLRGMIEFHVAVLRPDGLLPQVGDADDGRLHVFTGYGSWAPQDGRHILAPAALMFDRSEWLALAGETGPWEAGWWGYETEAPPAPAHLPDTCRLFPDAGLAVFRERGNYLLVTNGHVGTKGIGNHKHNDQLGFEYHVAGEPVLVDPGSLAYTGDPETRNRLRGTASHNTLRIDGAEQNELRPDWLFRMFEKAFPEHLRFEATEDWVEYQGRHSGYGRLAAAVSHERTIRLLRGPGSLLVLDRLRGTGEHAVEWHFHAAPGITLRREGERVFELTGAGVAFCLCLPDGVSGTIVEAVYSPSYGVRLACSAVEVGAAVVLRGEVEFLFVVGKREWFEGLGGERGMAELRRSLDERPSSVGMAS